MSSSSQTSSTTAAATAADAKLATDGISPFWHENSRIREALGVTKTLYPELLKLMLSFLIHPKKEKNMIAVIDCGAFVFWDSSLANIGNHLDASYNSAHVPIDQLPNCTLKHALVRAVVDGNLEFVRNSIRVKDLGLLQGPHLCHGGTDNVMWRAILHSRWEVARCLMAVGVPITSHSINMAFREGDFDTVLHMCLLGVVIPSYLLDELMLDESMSVSFDRVDSDEGRLIKLWACDLVLKEKGRGTTDWPLRENIYDDVMAKKGWYLKLLNDRALGLDSDLENGQSVCDEALRILRSRLRLKGRLNTRAPKKRKEVTNSDRVVTECQPRKRHHPSVVDC